MINNELLAKLKNTILITGGAGFIGSNLCKAFLEDGLNVVCFDNFLTGKRENINSFLSHENFKLVEGDIRDVSAVETVMKGVDFVSHQAALGSVPRSIENPQTTSEINTQGFLNVLTAAKNEGVKRFVYASSSSVYGDSILSPKVESEIGKPLSPYAVSKLTNELYGQLFFKLYGIQTVGLRYFNVFGVNQDPNGVYAAAIPKFINKFMSGEAPTIYGDGNQTRDFTHITNVIEANKLAISCEKKEAFGEIFNVACGASYPLNNVVALIKKALMDNDVAIGDIYPQHTEERQGDVRDSLANTSKIERVLGYQIQTEFENGIQSYVKSLLTKKSYS